MIKSSKSHCSALAGIIFTKAKSTWTTETSWVKSPPLMKRIPVAEKLLVALAAIALLMGWFVWNHHRAVKALRVSLQIDGNRMVLNTFFTELEDYGRKNPAV